MNPAHQGLGERGSVDPRMVAIYRRATPSDKLAVVARLNATLIALKEAAIAVRFPTMVPEARHQMPRRWWLTAAD